MNQEIAAKIQASKERKAKRELKRKEIAKAKGVKALSPKKLRKKLWDVFSAFVRARDVKLNSGRCLICNARPIECAYHLIPQNEGNACRYDEEAVVGACHICNGLERNFRRRYWLKHVALFGEERMKRLDQKSSLKVQYRSPDYRAMIEYFQGKIWAL